MFIYAKLLQTSTDVTVTIHLAADDSIIVENAPMISIAGDLFKYEFNGDTLQDYYYVATDNLNAGVVAYEIISAIVTAVVNKLEIKDIFDNLMSDIKTQLDAQYDNSRIDTQGYASIVAETMKNAQNQAVDLYLQTTLNAARIQINQAQSQKDLQKKDATIKLTNRQTEALNDALKVKFAELLGNTLSLIESGGNTAPAQVWTKFNSAVDKIAADVGIEEPPVV